MMKKILVIAGLTFLLQGCVAGVFAAGGVAAGSSVSGDSRSMQTITDDNQITYLAEQQIAANPTLSNQAHIVVATYNQVVLLAGQAPTQDMRDQAVQLVKSLPNVKIARIFNEIEVGSPTKAVRRSKDAAVTTNIRTRMLTTTNLKSNQFKVVTENGTVFLMGLSTRQQADVAVAVVRNSTGVQRVVRLVQYISPTAEQ
jgi:osmotically-inducible protein OsmY